MLKPIDKLPVISFSNRRKLDAFQISEDANSPDNPPVKKPQGAPDGGLKPESPFETIAQNFILRQPSHILEFIDSHPFLESLLLETYRAVSKHFGPSPRIALELMHDPEVPDASELIAFIQTHLSPDEVLEKLDQLEEDWWLDALERAGQEFSINLEFV